MRAYRRPTMEIEKFQVNQAVAACSASNSSSYKAQDIKCVIEQEVLNLFYQGAGMGCTTYPGRNSQLVNYGGVTYYLWYTGGQPTTEPDEDSEAYKTLRAVMEIADVGDENGWHAGAASKTLISLLNHS